MYLSWNFCRDVYHHLQSGFEKALFSAALPSLNPRQSVPLKDLFSIVRVRLREQIDLFLRNRAVAANLLLVALFFSAPTAVGGIAPGFIEQALKIDARDLSFVGILPLALGLLSGAVLLNRRGERWEVWKSVLGFGATLLLMAVAPNLRIFFANHVTTPQAFESFPFFSLAIGALFFFLGLFASTFAIFMVTSLQRITPGENLGRTFGVLGTLSALLTGVWVIGFGTLADLFGPVVPITLVGLCAVPVAFWIKRRGVIK